MIHINKKRFYNFLRNCICIIAVILLCVFISTNSGLDKRSTNEAGEIHEYRTYEFEYQTCKSNNRIKEAIPVEVVYRYVTR